MRIFELKSMFGKASRQTPRGPHATLHSSLFTLHSPFTLHSSSSGFTIVELLMVIAVLAVLTGIVTTAASAAIRQARERRTTAMKNVLQNGIATYLAQNGRWPGSKLKDWSDNGLPSGKKMDFLAQPDYDDMVKELLNVSVGPSATSPVLDPGGMIVAENSISESVNTYGLDYRTATAKNKKRGKTISVRSMTFGYAESSKGYFRRFVVQYNAETDSVTVMTRQEFNDLMDKLGLSYRWPNKP